MNTSIVGSNERVAIIENMSKGFVSFVFTLKLCSEKKYGDVLRQEVNNFYDEVNKVRNSFSKEMSQYTDSLSRLDFGTDTKVKSITE